MGYSKRKGLAVMALLCGLILIVPSSLFAGAEARISGTVKDPDGNPISGVKATLTSKASGESLTRESNKKGRFAFLVIDATHPPYNLTLEKEGYETLSGPIDLKVGGTERKEYTMPPAKSAAPEMPAEMSGDSDAVKLFNEGATLYNGGDVDGAVAKFEAAVEKKPDLTQALSLLSGIYADRGDFEKSLDYANKLLEVNPEDPQALLFKFDALSGLGKTDEAKETLQEAIKVAPPGEIAKRLYNLGAKAQRAGDKDEALDYLKQATQVDPTMMPALSALAGMYLTQKDYSDAVATAEKILQQKPNDAEALTIQYEAYKGLGDKAKSDAAYAALQSGAGSDPEALYRKGVALFNSSNFDGAIEALKQALAAKPDMAGAHYTLGLALLNKGDSAGAKEHLQKFLELSPNDPNADSAKQMLDYLNKQQ